MFTKSFVSLSLVLSAFVLTNCSDRPDKPQIKAKPKTSEVALLGKAGDLIGTWVSCVDSTPSAHDVVKVKDYPIRFGTTLSLDAEGKGSIRRAYYSDKNCTIALTDAQRENILAHVKDLRANAGAPELTAEEVAAFANLKEETKELTYQATDASEAAAGEVQLTSDGETSTHTYSVADDELSLEGEPFTDLTFIRK